MASPFPKITFHFHEVSFLLKNRRLLKAFLKNLFSNEGKELKSLKYIFCSDEFLLEINQQFLKHDFYTDIITFELSATSQIEGEIYISLDRVKENSTKHRATTKEELLRVIFHGALHLCGFKDKTKREKTEMRKKEEEYLAKYALNCST